MNSGMPEIFRISISSFYGRSYTILLRDDMLLYNSTRPEKQITRFVSEDDWHKFWKKTVNLKVWLWQTQYVDKSSSDGTSWSVNMEIGKLKLKAYGSNQYPENFREFLQALSDLTAGLELVAN
jgi:hypothetical protein